MARTIPLLDAARRRTFDQPPKFNHPQRQLFFALPDWATEFLYTLLAPHSRGGFVLQVGYFKATGRFFPADRDYAVLHALFTQVHPIVQALDLSEEVVRFYARYVERAQVFQVQQQAEKKYLMVLCFVVYQYCQVGDLLTETLLQAVQTHRNAAQRETQERVYRQQQDTAGQLRQVLDGVVTHGAALAELEELAFSFARTNAEKVASLLAWLQTPTVTAFARLRQNAQHLRKGGGGSTSGPYYQVVEERSRALQRRLGEILRTVAYEGTADNPLKQALTQYRARDGQVGSHPPTGFLKAAERTALDQAESPVSLYKALLAGHVADQLKAGKLNLAHSLRYRPFDNLLIGRRHLGAAAGRVAGADQPDAPARARALAGGATNQAHHRLCPHLRAAKRGH